MKNCKYCESIISEYSLICKKKECKNSHARFLYKNRKKNKNCSNCEDVFLGTSKEKLCFNCKKESSKLRKDGLEKIEKKVLCRNCNKQTGTKIVYKTKQGDSIISGTCDACLKKTKELQSERMKGSKNPNFNGKYNKLRVYRKLLIEKKKRKKVNNKRKEEIRKIRSDFMKKNNPMYDRKIKEKVKNTINEKRKNGEIKYKTGREHHSWKGNRPFDKIIRTRLKWWRKLNIKKSNYTCGKCHQVGGKLEVHHIIPFRDIIVMYIKKPLNEYLVESEEFEELIKMIVEYHKNNNIGIVLCKKCHSEEDEYRKI